MGTFDYNSFVDLSLVFGLKKGDVVPPKPKARVILYTTTALPQSRFVDIKAFHPQATSRFMSAAMKTMPAVTRGETPKPRGTLRLKKKVELPPIITRRSSIEDLAAAFKAEIAQTEREKSPLSLPDEPFKRKHHPLSSKPWSALIAEAEAAMLEKNKKAGFDLGAAFKAEMKAFMAAQERLDTTAHVPPAKPLKLAA